MNKQKIDKTDWQRATKGLNKRHYLHCKLIDSFIQIFQYSFLVYYLTKNTYPYIQTFSLSLSSKDECHIIYLDGPPSYNKTGPVFGSAWYKPVKEARPEAQVSVLELFTAGIHLNVSCVGKACTYDPPTPPPKHLTCHDNPCPTGQECCKYPDTDSYTCCAPNQKCSYGYCD